LDISDASAGKKSKVALTLDDEGAPQKRQRKNPIDAEEKAIEQTPSEAFISKNFGIIKKCAREGEMFNFNENAFGVINLNTDSDKMIEPDVRFFDGYPISPKYHEHFDNFFNYEFSVNGESSGNLTIGKISKNISTEGFVVNETIEDKKLKEKNKNKLFFLDFLFLDPSQHSADENYNIAMKYRNESILQSVKILRYAADVQNHSDAAYALCEIYNKFSKIKFKDKKLLLEKYFKKFNIL
jgi:hypothetical protein